MAKLISLETVQMTAIKGDVDAAELAYTELVRAGNPRAAAALAEIAAFRGDWEASLAYLDMAFGAIGKFDTWNVQTDLTILSALAAQETGNWEALESIVRKGRSSLGKQHNPELSRLLVGLGDFAADQGASTFPVGTDPEPDGKVRFEDAIAKLGNKKFRTHEARADHLYGLARVFDHSGGAFELYGREGTLPGIFDNVLFLAEALAIAGQPDAAWNAIETRLDRWWPVEDTQIVPVPLLTNPELARLMTPERCAAILTTPRGPMAV